MNQKIEKGNFEEKADYILGDNESNEILEGEADEWAKGDQKLNSFSRSFCLQKEKEEKKDNKPCRQFVSSGSL